MFDNINTIKDLKRNDKVRSKIKKSGDNIVAKETLYILIPSRYENADLMHMSDNLTVLAIYMLVDGDGNYDLVINPTMITTDPAEIYTTKLDDVEYNVFKYNKDSAIVKGVHLPMSDGFAYDLFKEFVMKGNTPKYIEYFDLYKIFTTIGEFTGSSIGNGLVEIALLVSLVYRSDKDLNVYYRHILKNVNDTPPYKTISINNIERGIKDPLAIMTGAYFKRSTTKLLNMGDNRPEPTELEKIMLK